MWSISRTGVARTPRFAATASHPRDMKLSSFLSPAFGNLALVLAIGLFSSCGSTRKLPVATDISTKTSEDEVAEAAEAEEAREVYGPFPNASPIDEEGVPPVVDAPERIVLVFGSGLAHGFAYVGVLRALQDLKIEVQSIYATEVGALAAALYFTQPNANRVDWALMRFNEKNLRKPEGKFTFRLGSPEGDLESKLREVFGEKTLDSLQGRLHVTLENSANGKFFEAQGGDLREVLRAGLSGANGFSSIPLEGNPARAASKKLSETYRLARQRENAPVVVVSAGVPPSESFRKLVQEQNSTLIHVPLSGIDDLDLKKRNQAVFLGKSATQKSAGDLLRLVGRNH